MVRRDRVAISKFPGQLKEAMDLDLSALDPDPDHAIREALRPLNGRIPLLALEHLRQRTRRSFTYAVDSEV